MISPQFLRFLVAGGIAAGANFGSRFVFSMFVSYGFAVFFAYLVGMLVAFLLMRGHVFNASQGPLAPQIYKFVAVNVLAVLQTLAISLLLARWLLPSVGIVDHAEAIGHLVGVLVPVVTSYFGHKLLTFR
ncbi:GtrA family protein [Pantoea sp. At-9b]|jgi:putative flippase GtrA|uniref:GtrA family protein n=1 Tax=Pantoea sp. (strain At-9b) TaxID=592316 RepID=UPI0001B40D33|nr:GtrA family protein [Pantoea sp. At-9b]ADU70299.1 GtrA family protein [Pantoea sp. At-9b]